VSFTGDPDNPQLVVTASIDVPDGTRIFADVIGPSKTIKVTLRSEPARSQDEILGLLLFGSEEGLAGSPPPDQQPDPTQRAAGVASGPVTQAINKALAGISALEVTTRIDTSQAANPRPEVEVRLTSEMLARVTVQTGMPAPGEPPDRTLLTIDWRFTPRWSLESTVGDEGSTFIDLLWHHRY
jgi:autotransporter translocation and assembly factor TamB